MEIETVMSYIAASVNLDGVRAQAVTESSRSSATHSAFAARIKASRQLSRFCAF